MSFSVQLLLHHFEGGDMVTS